MKKNINELKPHPRNQEFFDDIEGEKWDEFLESISHGVIEPLVITQDDVIVSGHQRVRALKEIGKRETVNCIVKEYEDEDEVLLDLIESNIKQRGEVGGSYKKIVARIDEVSRIKGIRSGSAGSPTTTWGSGVTRQDVLDQFGISESSYERYKKLASAIPELSEAIEAGTVSQGAALAMVNQLSDDEQLELISSLDVTRAYTERETADLIEEIEELRNRPAEAKEPADYQQIKSDLAKANKTVTGLKKDYQRLRNDLESRITERNELRAKLKGIEDADSGNVKKKHQIDTGAMFSVRVNQFIEDVAGYIWLTDEVMELPESDRIKFIRSVKKIQDWANQMETNIRLKTEAE